MKEITTGQLFGYSDDATNWAAVGVVLELSGIFKINFSLDNNIYDVLGKLGNSSNYYEGILRRKKDKVGMFFSGFMKMTWARTGNLVSKKVHIKCIILAISASYLLKLLLVQQRM